MTRPYQDLIDQSKEQIVKCRAWSQRSFDDYMEALAETPASFAIARNAHQTRLHLLMIDMKIANSWVDYWIGSEKNYRKMRDATERIERLLS